ncbi:MAG: 30S ribosomal protein S13 [Bacteroidota bacterium]
MARIVGVDIPDNKQGEIALRSIFGIGPSLASQILVQAGVDKHKRVSAWSEAEFNTVRSIINEQYQVEGDLRSEIRLHIKRLIDIKSYRGRRHAMGLPLRGQKTKNNARTRKGKPKTIANKKKATKK